MYPILTPSRRLVSVKTIGYKIYFNGTISLNRLHIFPGKKFRKRSEYGKFILNGLHRDNLPAPTNFDPASIRFNSILPTPDCSWLLQVNFFVPKSGLIRLISWFSENGVCEIFRHDPKAFPGWTFSFIILYFF